MPYLFVSCSVNGVETGSQRMEVTQEEYERAVTQIEYDRTWAALCEHAKRCDHGCSHLEDARGTHITYGIGRCWLYTKLSDQLNQIDVMRRRR